jgi:hypothetical protein
MASLFYRGNNGVTYSLDSRSDNGHIPFTVGSVCDKKVLLRDAANSLLSASFEDDSFPVDDTGSQLPEGSRLYIHDGSKKYRGLRYVIRSVTPSNDIIYTKQTTTGAQGYYADWTTVSSVTFTNCTRRQTWFDYPGANLVWGYSVYVNIFRTLRVRAVINFTAVNDSAIEIIKTDGLQHSPPGQKKMTAFSSTDSYTYVYPKPGTNVVVSFQVVGGLGGDAVFFAANRPGS